MNSSLELSRTERAQMARMRKALMDVMAELHVGLPGPQTRYRAFDALWETRAFREERRGD